MRLVGALVVVATCGVLAACSGNSNDGDAGDSTNTPDLCDRFQAAETIQDACSALLVACPPTLHDYLAAGHVAPQSYARVGCGLTEIRDVTKPGARSSTYTFDGTGALVGFDLTYPGSELLCDTGEYRFGTLLAACDAVRECHVPKDAADTGNVCGCTCPDPPPEDGIFTTTPDCVYPAAPIADCATTLDAQLEHYASQGLEVRHGCGFVVTGSPSPVTCIYDATDMLVGSSRADGAGEACGGVTVLQTGQIYDGCDAEERCLWSNGGDVGPASSDLESCGEVPPAPTGEDSCTLWMDEADVAASCALVAGDACPADEASYLASLGDPTLIQAVVGCGVTWYEPSDAPASGDRFAFDSAGNLVGYRFAKDVTFGPCRRFGYELGPDLAACADVMNCGLNDDRAPSCR